MNSITPTEPLSISPDAPESPQDGQETVFTPERDQFHVQFGTRHNLTGYAVVRQGTTAYRVNWQRPFCTCPDFTRDREICTHIRAAQDEANRQAEARQERGETPEEKRARVQAILDEEFDER